MKKFIIFLILDVFLKILLFRNNFIPFDFNSLLLLIYQISLYYFLFNLYAIEKPRDEKEAKKQISFIHEMAPYFWTFFAFFTASMFLFKEIDFPKIGDLTIILVNYFWAILYPILYHSFIIIPILYIVMKEKYYSKNVVFIFLILNIIVGVISGFQSAIIGLFIIPINSYISNYIAIIVPIILYFLLGIFIKNNYKQLI